MLMTIHTAARRLPAQARSRARFDQILAAAGELIGERGLEPVTLTDIAERAGMPLTAVYRYFPNKQSVLRELTLQTFAYDTETLVATGVGSLRDRGRTALRRRGWRPEVGVGTVGRHVVSRTR